MVRDGKGAACRNENGTTKGGFRPLRERGRLSTDSLPLELNWDDSRSTRKRTRRRTLKMCILIMHSGFRRVITVSPFDQHSSPGLSVFLHCRLSLCSSTGIVYHVCFSRSRDELVGWGRVREGAAGGVCEYRESFNYLSG